VVFISRIDNSASGRLLLLSTYFLVTVATGWYGGINQSLAQDSSVNLQAATDPAQWPWGIWQRKVDGIERWQELDTGITRAWRQSLTGMDGSSRGAVFFVVPASSPNEQDQHSLPAIEFPRLNNVVERAWWWPLEGAQPDTETQAAEPEGSAYSMPFVPPQAHLMKLTQSPTRWTLSFTDGAAAANAMRGGGILILDVRDTPQLNDPAEQIRAGKDGVIVMPASKSRVFGQLLQFEPLPHKNTVGYWVNADDFATWNIAVEKPGEYHLHVLQGCGAGQGGSRIALSIGDNVVETKVQETGHFQNFRWRDLGTVSLQAASELEVSLRCLEKAKAAVMDVRQIRLVPADAKMPSDEREVTTDIDLPPLTHEPPAPGRRSIRKAAIVDSSDAYHLLTLPTDWSASRRYPVMVEWTGNGPYENDRGDRSSGRVEDARLAYGLGGGDGWIVLSLPFLNEAGTANVSQWWGDAPTYRPDSTIAYAKAAIDEACEQFGGDRTKLILVGFSRGAIACNAVGLSNDEVASWWRGFVCFSHYDGVRPWPPTGDESASLERLYRLGNRLQLIASETPDGGAISIAQQTMQYLKRTSVNQNNLQQLETGFANHSDGWAMRPGLARDATRGWLNSCMEN